MRSPFPGMNPYLEAPALWSEVHSWLIIELAKQLNQSITPKYRAAVEKRMYEEKSVKRYLEIREVTSGEVITVIEVLSPKNKRTGEGRNQYLSKRMKVLNSQSHLVEIDLLRGGEALPMNYGGASDYRVLVSRVEQRPMAQLYPFDVRSVMPCFVVPLRSDDELPVIDLNDVMQRVYQSAALEFAIDYAQQPNPALDSQGWAWAQELLIAINQSVA